MSLTRRAVVASLLLSRPARAETVTLAGLMARLAAVPERRATFREERTLAALTTPLVSTGRLLYRRPDYVRKETLWPQLETLTIEGSRLVIAEPGSNDPPRVVDLSWQPALRALADAIRAPLAGDLTTLRAAFEPTLSGTPERWALALRPLGAAATTLRAIELTGSGDWIDSIRTETADGDRTALAIAP